jgi:hypothetical protein
MYYLRSCSFWLAIGIGSLLWVPKAGAGPSSGPPADAGAEVASASIVPSAAIAPLSNQPVTEDLLAKAREAAARMFTEVENVICREDVKRFKSGRGGAEHQVDVIQTQVTVENGGERYTSVLQNNRKRNRMSDIGGAWSEGEYATFLGEARQVLSSNRFIHTAYLADLNGVPATVFPFEVNQGDTSWDFKVSSHHYSLPFQGELWVSSATGEVLRIRRIARQVDPATGIAEVDWTVDFASISIDGRTLSLPAKALYIVTYSRDQSRQWNAVSFSSYHHFGSDAVIRYNTPGSLETAVALPQP